MQEKICDNKNKEFCFYKPGQREVKYSIKVSEGEIISFDLIVYNKTFHHCLNEGDYFWQRIRETLGHCYRSDKELFKSMYNMLNKSSKAIVVAKEVLISISGELKEKVKNIKTEIDEISSLIC